MAQSSSMWGMVPAILKMSKDPTNFYIGRPLWFSLTALYVSVVYVVQISWIDLAEDFQCHGNISIVCLAECYENHFNRPILGVWYVIGFIFSSIFFVMEFFVSQSVHRLNKIFKKKSLKEDSSSTDIKAEDVKTKEEGIFDLTQEKHLLAMYLVYFLVQLFVQVVFLVILLHYHLPLIKEPILCTTHMCPGPYPCVIRGTQEKMMSIILLGTVSVVIMTFCVMFFLYIVNEYVLKGSILAQNYKSSIQLDSTSNSANCKVWNEHK